MGLSESDTRAKLIDPAIHARGWTEDLIRREETAGTIQIIAGQPRKQCCCSTPEARLGGRHDVKATRIGASVRVRPR